MVLGARCVLLTKRGGQRINRGCQKEVQKRSPSKTKVSLASREHSPSHLPLCAPKLNNHNTISRQHTMGLSSREPFARMVEDAPWLKSHSHIGSSPVQHASYLCANRRQINANDEDTKSKKFQREGGCGNRDDGKKGQ